MSNSQPSLILVLNCGSSSIKFALFDAQARPLPRKPFWHGKVQGITGLVPEYSDSGTAQQRIHLDHEHPHTAALALIQARIVSFMAAAGTSSQPW